MKAGLIRMSSICLLTLLLLPTGPSNVLGGMREVRCNSGQTIQKALDTARDGDVIEVFGACSENVVIEKNRITLKGGAGATLHGPDSNVATILVRGLNVRVTGFSSLSGGLNIIQVGASGSAVIQNNTLENGRRGILVGQNAHARIEGNTIRNNAGDLGDAITIRQSAAADIFSNTIAQNLGHGIRVDDAAAADIDSNTIVENGGDGIFVRFTSHIRLSLQNEFGQANFVEGNDGWGIRCQQNSSIRSGTSQDFGVGNGLGNALLTGCVVGGPVL